MSTATRESLIGSGEHLFAVRKLGAEYSDAEYVQAIGEAREAGVGTAYADAVLGVDSAEVLKGVVEDDGEEVVRAAERHLRSRGIDPVRASYREYAEALVAVSS